MKRILSGSFLFCALVLAMVISLPVPQSPLGEPGHAHAEELKFTCGMHPMIIRDEPGLCPICSMDLTPMKPQTGGGASASGERKIKYWAAPMDPTYIRQEPGKSPMGMDLVPVYEDQASSGSVVSVDPVTAQNMGIRVERVKRGDLARTVRALGIVAYDESRQYSINSKVDGWIEKLHVNETGQMVEQGQPLLEIYSPELVSAQQEFLLALSSQRQLASSPFPEIAEGARRLLEASRERLRYWDISDSQIEKLEQRGEISRTMTLHSPYPGVVTGSGRRPRSSCLTILIPVSMGSSPISIPMHRRRRAQYGPVWNFPTPVSD